MEKSDKSIFHFLEIPDYLTLLGGMLGILGVFAAINHRLSLAAVLFLFTVPCDYFDGKIARAVGRRHTEFGEALDTIVDTVSFGIGPVIFGYCLGLNSLFHIVILMVFAGAAILRLARFSVLTADPEAFTGMPVTYNNLIFPILYFLVSVFSLCTIMPVLFSLLYLASAALMASTIRWKKF